MNTAIYTLTSSLHDAKAVDATTHSFLDSLGIDYEYKGEGFADYGTHPLDLIFVRTGGTEGLFKRLLVDLRQQSQRPIYLLTSGKSNSLAASMEILSFLRQHDIPGEILHGNPDYIRRRIHQLHAVGKAIRQLNHSRLGIVGQPSDWLISSTVDRVAVRQRLGIELIDIDLQTLIDAVPMIEPDVQDLNTFSQYVTDKNAQLRSSLPDALRIYQGLRQLVDEHQLNGLTIRCFDLLTALHNTGCLALSRLNCEGLVAGCEGDIPAMLTMHIARALTSCSGFQANPAFIDTEKGEVLLAHCTIPLDMLHRFEFDTHFESGIGVAIRGYMDEGPVTLFKVSGDLRRYFVAEGTLLRCDNRPDLCRTQVHVRLNDASQAQDFLTKPIGNHHILLPGHHRELIETFFKQC